MRLDELTTHFPVLYHMAADGSWDSIRRHGLLSTTALVDLFDYSGPEREAIEARRRPTAVDIHHPIHGTAVIRDQSPLSDEILRRCLVDMEPVDWYRLLNGKVFFWLGRRRLETLLNARLYRGQVHTVLTVDTASLVHGNVERITLSRINTGATHRGGSPRGSATFHAIADYPFNAGRRTAASIGESVAELAIAYGVSEIEEHVIRVDRVRDGLVVETLHDRSPQEPGLDEPPG